MTVLCQIATGGRHQDGARAIPVTGKKLKKNMIGKDLTAMGRDGLRYQRRVVD